MRYTDLIKNAYAENYRKHSRYRTFSSVFYLDFSHLYEKGYKERVDYVNLLLKKYLK